MADIQQQYCWRLVAVGVLCLLLLLLHVTGHVNGATIPRGTVEVQHDYGKLPEGRRVSLVTLKRGPLRLSATNWGATITNLYLPDFNGKEADVVLGLSSFHEYHNGNSPYFGALVGRVANRIAKGTFVLDNVRYNLTKNEGNNTLHGGKIGFNKVLWKFHTEVDKVTGSPSATFTYHSFDGEQGFPGDVNVSVTYKLIKPMELLIEMRGHVGKKATPVNLAQHTYWNLGGHASGSILNNTVKIAGNKVTEVDSQLIPTGRMVPVAGTAYDLRQGARIGSRVGHIKGGFDINYALVKGKKNKKGAPHKVGRHVSFAAKVADPRTGRSLELYTDQPGVQFYTANQLHAVEGKGGAVYRQHAGLCLETQGFPNAVNVPSFPSVIVKPFHTYHHTMLFRFHVSPPSHHNVTS